MNLEKCGVKPRSFWDKMETDSYMLFFFTMMAMALFLSVISILFIKHGKVSLVQSSFLANAALPLAALLLWLIIFMFGVQLWRFYYPKYNLYEWRTSAGEVSANFILQEEIQFSLVSVGTVLALVYGSELYKPLLIASICCFLLYFISLWPTIKAVAQGGGAGLNPDDLT